jgi:hypothetical protein
MERLASVQRVRNPARSQSGWYRLRANRLLHNYRNIDKSKGHDNDLCPDYVGMVIARPCFYCGTTDADRGLDRLDNKKGHLRTNVVSCCRLCNVARMDMFTVFEMMNYIGPAINLVRYNRLSSQSNQDLLRNKEEPLNDQIDQVVDYQ